MLLAPAPRRLRHYSLRPRFHQAPAQVEASTTQGDRFLVASTLYAIRYYSDALAGFFRSVFTKAKRHKVKADGKMKRPFPV
jgi:hypothetical protein